MRILVATIVMLLLAPEALACTACAVGMDDETRGAFFLTTIMMSILPLGLIGGFVAYLVRRARKLERERREARPVPAEVAEAFSRSSS